jgi:AraC-like DNA-binding protein
MWMCRLNAGQVFHPVSVEFIHDQPNRSGSYRKFFKCPVKFGARQNCLTFNREGIERELDTANPHLAQLNDQIMVKAIARLSKSKIVDRARAAIIEELPSGMVTDDLIADKLNISVRTFQRKLRAEGVTFKALLNQVRRGLGQKYIRNSALSLTEISFLLGFSELSAFSSAYKRWVGHSPSEERRAV